MDALTVYGYGAYGGSRFDRPVAENFGNNNPTDHTVTDQSPTGMTVGGVLGSHHSLGHTNPLFWLLIFCLVATGYIGLLFDARVKPLGEVRTKVGR